MSVSDWINFAALANIIVFLWVFRQMLTHEERVTACLLYTSDAADEL